MAGTIGVKKNLGKGTKIKTQKNNNLAGIQNTRKRNKNQNTKQQSGWNPAQKKKEQHAWLTRYVAC